MSAIDINAISQIVSQELSLSTTDIAIYFALFVLYTQQNKTTSFYISRSEVMQISHVHSNKTYHQSIRKLVALHLICYTPSFNKYGMSVVSFNVKFNPDQPS